MGGAGRLLAEIRALEERLHRPEVRRSRQALEALLAEDFVEFGSSGTVYRRAQIIELMAQEQPADVSLHAFDYALTQLGADAVLLTYRTSRSTGAERARHVLRSSIWTRTAAGWRMTFHQGTVMHS
ncbi:MAG: DUF3225 domain-containing protein [Rhizobiales bacterium]|nr:DUF3225 domain-containing protein [Hyphomicrobiales bacterium]